MIKVNKKELEQKIKDAALNIEVKDFSTLIIDRQKQLDEKQVVSQTNKPKFNFKLIFSSMMVSLAAVIFMIVLLPKDSIPPVDHPTIESPETVMAVSGIQSMSLMESFEEDTSDVGQFRLGIIERNDTIKSKLDIINKYLRATEKIYASNEGYDAKIESYNQQGYAKRLSFNTKDFTNQEDTYELIFNQINDQETDEFIIFGEINDTNNSYRIDARGDSVSGEFQLITRIDNDNYIKIKYQNVDDSHQFMIDTYRSGEIVETVSLKIDVEDNVTKTTITMGLNWMTSTFTIETSFENQNRIMRIHYHIETNSEPLEGDITIRVIKQAGLYFYVMTIKPQDGNPFSYNQRRNGQQSGRQQTVLTI